MDGKANYETGKTLNFQIVLTVRVTGPYLCSKGGHCSIKKCIDIFLYLFGKSIILYTHLSSCCKEWLL